MNEKAKYYIQKLQLKKHPEGGYFREVYRSGEMISIDVPKKNLKRNVSTSIYFLLEGSQISKFHRLKSDELWHFCEGDPLDLHCIDPGAWEAQILRLGPRAEGVSLVHVIRAGCWQAACSTGGYTLVGCTVAPGFEYRDYRIFEDGSAEAAELRRRFPGLARFL